MATAERHPARVSARPMALIDALLNFAALLMWLSWCGVGSVEAAGPAGTILGNLRPAATRVERRWIYLAGLAALLLVRALLYRQVGPSLLWHPVWNNGAILVAFRSDLLLRMLAYSFLSFGWLLFHWYAALVLVSAVNPSGPEADPVTRQVRRALGFFGRWPAWLLLPVPFIALGLGWMGVGWLAARHQLLPPVPDPVDLVRQAGVVGAGALLAWRWFLSGLYVLHFLNTYVYLGRHPFWEFVQVTGTRLSLPFRWARLGRIDVSPLIGLVVVVLLALLLSEGWPWLARIERLRPLPVWMEQGILPTMYRNLPRVGAGGVDVAGLEGAQTP